ncbi:hypothetical protein H4W33_004407 [Kibdelosporangium phytohabitans]|uniref:Uncharacterized protein n=1 Tax=Kibdelosporangium phytohabitans TaxID=860235 RepID=A0A0N9I119_9PSEU|nr:hypothetical protein AOZ06_47720 [Kibdelosporangium phytohabitans]MBE1465395.1 hypothetical protein [Kibdelosporangium phytohabitans]
MTSGLRLGTNILAQRGMPPEAMGQRAALVDKVLTSVAPANDSTLFNDSTYSLSPRVRNEIRADAAHCAGDNPSDVLPDQPASEPEMIPADRPRLPAAHRTTAIRVRFRPVDHQVPLPRCASWRSQLHTTNVDPPVNVRNGKARLCIELSTPEINSTRPNHPFEYSQTWRQGQQSRP